MALKKFSVQKKTPPSAAKAAGRVSNVAADRYGQAIVRDQFLHDVKRLEQAETSAQNEVARREQGLSYNDQNLIDRVARDETPKVVRQAQDSAARLAALSNRRRTTEVPVATVQTPEQQKANYWPTKTVAAPLEKPKESGKTTYDPRVSTVPSREQMYDYHVQMGKSNEESDWQSLTEQYARMQAQRDQDALRGRGGTSERDEETVAGVMSSKGNPVLLSRRMDAAGWSTTDKGQYTDYLPEASLLTDDEVDYYSFLFSSTNKATADQWYSTLSAALEKRKTTPKSEWLSHNPYYETDYTGKMKRGMATVDFDALSQTDHGLPAYMTKDEREWYAYTKETFGQDEADAYYKTLRPVLNERKFDGELGAYEKNMGITGSKGTDPVGAVLEAGAGSVGSVAGGLVSGAGNLLEKLFKGEVDPYSENDYLKHSADALKRRTEGRIQNPTLKTAYQLGSTVAEEWMNYKISVWAGNRASGLLSKLGLAVDSAKAANALTKATNSILHSSSIFAHATQEALERGVSDDKAVEFGLVSAAVEAITETVGISAFLNDPANLKHVILSNVQEEMTANVASKIADVMVTQDKNAFRQSVNAYMVNEHMSEEDAFTQALIDAGGELLLDGIAGGLVGAALSLPTLTAKSSAVKEMSDKIRTGLVAAGVDAKTASKASHVLAKVAYGDTISVAEYKLIAKKGSPMLTLYNQMIAENSTAQVVTDADGVKSENAAAPVIVGNGRVMPDGTVQIAKNPAELAAWQAEAAQSAAQNENTAEDGGERYSIGKDVDGNTFVDVTEDILDPNSGESVARTIQRVLSDRFGNVVVANGQPIQVNKTTNDEFRTSKSARGVAKQSTQMYDDKLRTIANVDEIVTAARNWIGENIKHIRKDDIVEFARGNVLYRVGGNGYTADVIVGTRKNGAAVLYDLVDIQPTKIVEASVTMASPKAPNVVQNTSTEDTISQPATVVNPQTPVLQSTATNEGGSNNANISDGNEGRPAGVGAGGQAGSVRSGTEPSGREARRIDQLLDRVARSGVHFQSTKSLGISRGTDRMTAREVPSSLWDAEMQEADRRVYSVTGKHLRFVVGMMEIHGTRDVHPIKGVRTDTDIIVKADHPYLTPTKIALHEMFHELVAQYPQLRERAWQSIRNKFTDQQIGEIADIYRTNLQDVYDNENAIMDEVLADAYAGINMFGANTTMFSDAVQNATDTTLGEGRTAPANAASRAPPQSDGERMSVERKNFTEDKYFKQQIRRWEELSDGTRVKVGVVAEGSPLHQVGFPAERMFFDVGKIRTAMRKHEGQITLADLERISDILNDPIVIDEYKGVEGNIKNSVNVYGEVFTKTGEKPVLVGVTMVKDRSGTMLINKVRTFFPRGDLKNQITDDSVLYLNEDEKRTRKWFQVCDHTVPLEGTKFGLIRSIAYVSEDVKHDTASSDSESYSVDDTILGMIDEITDEPNKGAEEGGDEPTQKKKAKPHSRLQKKIAAVNRLAKSRVSMSEEGVLYVGNESGMVRLADGMFQQEDFDNVGKVSSELSAVFDAYRGIVERETKRGMSSPESAHLLEVELPTMDEVEQVIRDGAEENKQRMKRGEKMLPVLFTVDPALPPVYAAKLRDALRVLGENLQGRVTVKRKVGADRELLPWKYQRVYVKGNGGDALLAFAEENVVKAHGNTYASLFEPNGAQNALMRKIEQIQTAQEENGQRNEQENLVGRKQSKSKALQKIDEITDNPIYEGMNIHDWEAEMNARAEAKKQERLRTIPREEFVGSPALERLGIKVEGTVTSYEDAEYLRQVDKAFKDLERDTRKLEQKVGATPREKRQAALLAEGEILPSGIHPDARHNVVMLLAEQYSYKRAMGENSIRRHKRDITDAVDEQVEDLFRDVDKHYRPSKALVMNYRTPQRNMIRMFGDERGERIYRALFAPVVANEAERLRFANRMLDRVRTFKGADGKTAELTEAERAVAQVQLEGNAVAAEIAKMETRSRVEAAARSMAHGGKGYDARVEHNLTDAEFAAAKRMAWWIQAQAWIGAQKVDQTRVDNAVKEYSKTYDEFYDAINDFLVVHGYEPIGFVKGYAPHFQKEKTLGTLQSVLEHLGVNAKAGELPASIAGLTSEFKPGHRWDPHFKTRRGNNTDYDIAYGFEQYVDYISDVFYHTDDIMRVRRASTYFRTEYSAENISNLLDQIKQSRFVDIDTKRAWLVEQGVLNAGNVADAETVGEKMDAYVEELIGNLHTQTVYSEFVKWLDNYANILAGKQSMADRGWEWSAGRGALNIGNKAVQIFARSNIAANLSSALNQTAQLPTIIAECGAGNVSRAVRDILTGKTRRAMFFEGFDFVVGKKGVHKLTDTTADKALEMMFKPIEAVDRVLAEVAVRASYLKQLGQGQSHEAALKAADRYAAKVMGSRMKGEKPMMFQSKSIGWQMVNIFQVEALNSWEHITQDLPQEFRAIEKAQGKRAAAKRLAQVICASLLWAFLLNRLSEELYGGTPAPFDLLGLTANFIASGEGVTVNEGMGIMIDNAWERLFGSRLFNTDPDAVRDSFDTGAAVEDTLYNVSNEIPFVRNVAGLMGWGDNTMPMPDVYGAGKKVVDSVKNSGLLSADTATSAGELIAQFLPGGRQAKKTVQGIATMARGGAYKGDRLQYPVDGTWDEWIRGVMFGKSGLSETNAFYASGASGLSKKQTALYKSLVNSGADRKAVYDTISEVALLKDSGAKREAITATDFSDEQKAELYIGLVGSEKKIRSFLEDGMSWEKIAEALETEASAEKYADLSNAGLDHDVILKVSETIGKLVPEEGKKSVTSYQRQRAIIGMSMSEEEKMLALSAYMPESTYRKLEIVSGYDVTPTQWVTYFSAADKDESGNISQMEANMYLKTMTSLNSQQRAALWQATNAGWNPKSNPFSKSVSFKVQEKLKKE